MANGPAKNVTSRLAEETSPEAAQDSRTQPNAPKSAPPNPFEAIFPCHDPLPPFDMPLSSMAQEGWMHPAYPGLFGRFEHSQRGTAWIITNVREEIQHT